ncbi:MAG: endonuclease III [Ignavibacteria bacterium]
MPVKAKKKHALKVLELLDTEYPSDIKSFLDFKDPFELLIATILSAQCTDKRVNKVTPVLFGKFPTPQAFASAPAEEIEKEIFSTGFYKQKAKSIKSCCEDLIKKHGGEAPKDFNALTELAGVGRKTASVVMSQAFGVPAIAVDTHVKRLSNLLGFIDSDDAEKIEMKLRELFPEESWINISHKLIIHGREICIARRPKCHECVLNEICPSGII